MSRETESLNSNGYNEEDRIHPKLTRKRKRGSKSRTVLVEPKRSLKTLSNRKWRASKRDDGNKSNCRRKERQDLRQSEIKFMVGEFEEEDEDCTGWNGFLENVCTTHSSIQDGYCHDFTMQALVQEPILHNAEATSFRLYHKQYQSYNDDEELEEVYESPRSILAVDAQRCSYFGGITIPNLSLQGLENLVQQFFLDNPWLDQEILPVKVNCDATQFTLNLKPTLPTAFCLSKRLLASMIDDVHLEPCQDLQFRAPSLLINSWSHQLVEIEVRKQTWPMIGWAGLKETYSINMQLLWNGYKMNHWSNNSMIAWNDQKMIMGAGQKLDSMDWRWTNPSSLHQTNIADRIMFDREFSECITQVQFISSIPAHISNNNNMIDYSNLKDKIPVETVVEEEEEEEVDICSWSVVEFDSENPLEMGFTDETYDDWVMIDNEI